MIQFEDLIIDRPLQGIFENANGEIIGGINQLQDLSIETTSETKDKTDAQGVLIKRFFTAKNVEISGQNAVFSTSLASIQFGSDRDFASESNVLIMPRIFKINTDKIATTTDASGNTVKMYTLPDNPIEGTISICGCTNTGVPDVFKKFKAGVAVSETEYVLANNALTLPLNVTGTIQVKYDREVKSGMQLSQKADKFPNTCKFTLSALVCDPCDKETLRHAYIVFPSFQMSPDNTLSFNTEDTQSFSGTAQKDYCSEAHDLYVIHMAEDDIEE